MDGSESSIKAPRNSIEDSQDSIKYNKKIIIAVVLIIFLGIISVVTFISMSQSIDDINSLSGSINELTGINNTTDKESPNIGSDTKDTNKYLTNDSAGHKEDESIKTNHIKGPTDELRDVVVSVNSTDENPILEVQVGATTQSVALVDGTTDNSTVYSISQDRIRDRFEVRVRESNDTYSGVYYLWLVDNSGRISKHQINIIEDKLF